MSLYAVMLDLNASLKESLIREIQVIKAGFAIYSMSVPTRDTLSCHIGEIEAILSVRGGCKVETPNNHKLYLLLRISRSYIGFNSSKLLQIKIIGDVTAEVI